MKSLIRSAAAVVIVCALLFYATYALNATKTAGGAGVITVYNWGEYLDPDLLKRFTEETGIQVNYETFDSNEAMMTKIKQGGSAYDVAVPSEYAIEMMLEDNLLLPLDHAKLPNLANIDPYFLDLPFDPGNRYSVPYFWGTVGIVYNPNLIEPHLTFDSWQDLWDPSLKQKVFLVDGAREVIGMALNSLGESLNAKDDELLRQATERLIDLAPNVKAIIGDEITPLMVNNEAAVALTFSGQAADMMGENEELEFNVPREGSNLWFDNFVIPKTAKNIDGAHAFINFMLDAEVSAQNTDFVGYSTPNAAAMELLDEEVVTDERFYPTGEIRNHLEVYENLGLEWLGKYSEHYLKFKMSL
jgi:spermidine/putrescine transport system substrate-binding protein